MKASHISTEPKNHHKAIELHVLRDEMGQWKIRSKKKARKSRVFTAPERVLPQIWTRLTNDGSHNAARNFMFSVSYRLGWFTSEFITFQLTFGRALLGQTTLQATAQCLGVYSYFIRFKILLFSKLGYIWVAFIYAGMTQPSLRCIWYTLFFFGYLGTFLKELSILEQCSLFSERLS